ncbi:MAG: bifunctional adenosylcobinamide kinase/adenosylcobinamide-phosphate guanylyltransferase [Gammaproteobacteria bacterium]|nr:bifunctional adenosylcobinamide kinase/adenosylcobinamide-phosphate guanylyltransferase [Gammaproteobacteria bacterium]
MRELILGGARSGKSALAEQRAADSGLEVVYIATAEARDAEMSERIAHHRACRPGHWLSIEEPRQLAATLRQQAAPHRCLLVDCLTLWLSNLLAAGEAVFAEEREALLAQLPQLPGQLILVSNEVGLGIVPMGELTRRFCDESGRLHQAVAARCERVTFVTAGLPMILKGER